MTTIAFVHPELIGTVPAMEEYRMRVHERIAKWEASKAIANASGQHGLEHMVDGYIIELCAQHFYGLDSKDYGSIPALVNAMKEIDT